MKFNEKIVYCRKRAGLSQEALAERLGVSRQAVSKWENGESTPDLEKLSRMSKVFGVSADWLLSQEEPAEPAPTQRKPDWVDTLPGMLGRLVRRYGWLAGVRIAISGLGVAFVGGLARIVVGKMLSGFGMQSFGGMSFPGGFETLPGMVQRVDLVSNNPVYWMGTAFLILGVIQAVVGVVLAIYLKKHSDERKGDSI